MKNFIFLLLLSLFFSAKAQVSNVDSLNAIEMSDSTKQVISAPESGEKSISKPKILDSEPPDINEIISVSKIFWSIVFIALGYLVIRITSRVLEILAEKSIKYRITIKSFIPVIKILSWVLVIFIIVAGIFQPPAATLLAFSASVGVAIGFASQDILKNTFGGVMILFDRPFKSGDKIEVGGHYGEVVEIGLRLTRIVTPDDSLVSIPNSEVMNHSVSNTNAGESNCQVVAEFYLPIDADMDVCRTIATRAAKVSKFIYLNKPISVIFSNEFKDRMPILKMKLKAYVLDIRDEFKFKSDMTEITIKKLLEEKVIRVIEDNESDIRSA